MNRKIFLICSERSGSNLLTKIFNAHPDIAGPSPAHLFRAFLPREHSEYYSDVKNVIADVEQLWSLKMSEWMYKWERKDFVNSQSMAGVLHTVYQHECNLRKKKIAFIKEVKTYKLFERLVEHYPDCKFVYSVRDPRDMALSWSKDPVLRGDIVRASNVWFEDQLSSLRLYLRNPDRIAFLKYEELLADPQSVLRSVCDKLNIEYHEQMLSFSSRNEEARQSETVSWRNLAKPLLRDNFQKFRDTMSQEQIEYIEQKCGVLMDLLGYELSTDKAQWQPFDQLEARLRKEERHEKPEYQKISHDEQEKRKKWMETFGKITSH